jgi:PAS domain S-box-containing protein
LLAVLRSADLPTLTDELLAPQIDWSTTGDTEHFIQFYEHDEYLIHSVSAFVAAALNNGDCAVVIATSDHRDELQRSLSGGGVDTAKAEAAGRYVVLDAAATLSKFMLNGSPDPRRFQETIGPVIASLTVKGRRVHAFGEMVALLWAEGSRDSAVALEELWNDLGQRYRFALLCAYPINGVDGQQQIDAFNGVCSHHTRVIPAESYSAIETDDNRLRAISLLQQKAHSLKTEIEHRHVVEKALSEREHELADFFENATEGLHKIGPDGTILWANRADYGLLGFTADDYIGQPIARFHADADVIENILQTLRRGDSLVNFPARLRCKNGAIKHVLISSNACFQDGQFAYTRCFTRDVTQQWQAEKTLIEADRRKDEFLATLSHELRNPLAPIRNALELLDRRPCDATTMSQATGVIRRQVAQLTRLVDDLLDISRITRDKLDLRREDVDLNSIINSAVEASRPGIDAAGHQLQISLPEQPVLLNADSARLAQVFSNLLNNAAKFTPAGGVIQLEAKQHAGEAVVSVRDNGVGIACEALAYVFDMFRQVDDSLERSQGGLGIGLTLARRLVEMHGGTVNAQSEGTGKGSEFTVRLPVAVAKRSSKARQTVGEKPVAKRRILVVDDNKDSGDTLCILLRHKGHDVWTARDGVEAVLKAGELLPEIILMDVGMPKLNGYEATRRIRETPSGQDMFIIALTGWGQPSDVIKSREAGCSAHLVKPVDFAALDELLATAPTSG